MLKFLDCNYSNETFVFIFLGERLFINLSAICYSGNIYFDNNQGIDMGELFVGLCSTETITLVNETDELLSYIWTNNRNVEVDDLESHV